MAVRLHVQGFAVEAAVADLAATPGLAITVQQMAIAEPERSVDPLTVVAIITTSLDAAVLLADRLLDWRAAQRERRTVERAALEFDGNLRALDGMTREELTALIRKLLDDKRGEQA